VGLGLQYGCMSCQSVLSHLLSSSALLIRNFEHQTQASTGQTTGSWLIWFHKRGDETLLEGDRPEDEFWSDNNIVLGSVNADLLSDETIERFEVTDYPSFLFLHRGKLYRYPHATFYAWDDLKDFCLEPRVEAEDVPPPKSAFSKFIKKLHGPAGWPLKLALIFIIMTFILVTSSMGMGGLRKEKAM
jgi:hypothetical protein